MVKLPLSLYILNETLIVMPPPSSYSNHYARALLIALFVHFCLLGALSLNLHFTKPAPTALAANPIEANLVSDAMPVKEPLVKAKEPPPVKPATPEPLPKPAPPINKVEIPVATETDQATIIVKSVSKPVDKPLPKPVEKPLDKPVDKPPTPKNVTKIKQQAMLQAMQQEVEQQSQTPTKTTKTTKTKSVDKTLLAAALSSEIANESKQDALSAKTANAAPSPNTAEVDRYKGMILQQIQQNWIVPQHVDNLSCELRVSLAPGGTVLSVILVKSSGNEALDRSAIAAVNKSSPLPTPQKSSDFDAFRSFTITVKPEGSSFDEL